MLERNQTHSLLWNKKWSSVVTNQLTSLILLLIFCPFIPTEFSFHFRVLQMHTPVSELATQFQPAKSFLRICIRPEIQENFAHFQEYIWGVISQLEIIFTANLALQSPRNYNIVVQFYLWSFALSKTHKEMSIPQHLQSPFSSAIWLGLP